MTTVFTYFLYNPTKRLTKIGITTNPFQRFYALSKIEKTTLIPKALFIGDREGSFHRQFKKFRKHGEWFRLPKEISLSVESLPENEVLNLDSIIKEVLDNPRIKPIPKLGYGAICTLEKLRSATDPMTSDDLALPNHQIQAAANFGRLLVLERHGLAKRMGFVPNLRPTRRNLLWIATKPLSNQNQAS